MNYAKAIYFCAAVAITSGGLFLVASPAFGRSGPILVTGEAPENLVERHVSYADLNLAAAEGQRTLDRRVDVAVGNLCSEATGGDDGSVKYKFSMMKCSDEAWTSAQPQIDQAIQRAREIAYTGSSTLAAAAITISLPR